MRWLVGLALLLAGFTPGMAVAADAPFDLQAALAAAQPGATIQIPAGVYPGPLHIDKPVTLEGVGWPIIQGNGQGDVITVTAAHVTLRGLVIRGSGTSLDREDAAVTGLAPYLTVENCRIEDALFGVYLKQASHGIIRGNVIQAKNLPMARRGDGIRVWYSDHSLVEGNTVVGSRDVVIWFAPDSVIRHNRVYASRYGLHFMFSDNQVVEGNFLAENSVGAFLMYGRGLTLRDNVLYNNRGPSGYGVGMKDMDDVHLSGNRLVANRIGLYVDNSPREPNTTVTVVENLFAYNEVGLMLLPLTRNNIYTRNIFLDNGEQVAVNGGGQLSGNAWWQDGMGNYWSDYAGFDANGDRIGDIPYQSQSLYEDLMAQMPELRLFRLSPATDALDLAARAFPLFQPRPKLVDEYPLMAPPALPASASLPMPQPKAALATALGLVALALALLAVGLRAPWQRKVLL